MVTWMAVKMETKPHLWDDGEDVVYYRIGYEEDGAFIREAEDQVGNPDPTLPLIEEGP